MIHRKEIDTYNIKYEAVCFIKVGGMSMNRKVWGLNPAENYYIALKKSQTQKAETGKKNDSQIDIM